MTPKNLMVAVLLGALAAGAAWHLEQRGRWLERRADLIAQVDSTNTLLIQYWSDTQRRTTVLDSLLRIQQRLARDSAYWHQRYQQARRDQLIADTALARLRLTVNEDSLPQPVRALLAGERQATVACLATVETLIEGRRIAQEARSVCQTAQDTLQQEVVALQGLRARLSSERDSALALLKPPSLLSLTLEGAVGPGCVVSLSSPVCGVFVGVTLVRFRLPLVP